MDLWKISQSVNDDYETYDAAIVAAETEEEARGMHPDYVDGSGDHGSAWTWTTPDNVTVEHIGEASLGTKKGVILASFNA